MLNIAESAFRLPRLSQDLVKIVGAMDLGIRVRIKGIELKIER